MASTSLLLELRIDENVSRQLPGTVSLARCNGQVSAYGPPSITIHSRFGDKPSVCRQADKCPVSGDDDLIDTHLLIKRVLLHESIAQADRVLSRIFEAIIEHPDRILGVQVQISF